jgi:hypothetical protein
MQFDIVELEDRQIDVDDTIIALHLEDELFHTEEEVVTGYFLIDGQRQRRRLVQPATEVLLAGGVLEDIETQVH